MQWREGGRKGTVRGREEGREEGREGGREGSYSTLQCDANQLLVGHADVGYLSP